MKIEPEQIKALEERLLALEQNDARQQNQILELELLNASQNGLISDLESLSADQRGLISTLRVGLADLKILRQGDQELLRTQQETDSNLIEKIGILESEIAALKRRL